MPEDNIAVIYGKMTLEANTQEALDIGLEKQTKLNIDFPTGFNKDSCVCVAFGMKKIEDRNYSYETAFPSSLRFITGSFYREAILGNKDDNTKITLNVWQPTLEAITVYYKIVLMKIEPDVSNYELGDVNMDGQVTEADYTLLQNYLNGTGTLNEKQFKLADMDSNGILDVVDLTLLRRKIDGT